MSTEQKLIPELDVEDFNKSLDFYINVLGFEVQYSRPEEKFAMLIRDSIQIMLEEASGPGRRFTMAKLEKPYGRGVNFQISVSDVEELFKAALQAKAQIIIPIEEKWYRLEKTEAGNKQFVVADPSGNLLRFFQHLGERELR